MVRKRTSQNKAVMARLVRAIHDFAACAEKKDVDGPHEAGHDGVGWQYEIFSPHEFSPVPTARAGNR
jgi:hypothetical protein